jgi:hypothetical protein
MSDHTNCIVCDKELSGGKDLYSPDLFPIYNAIICSTTGNYGSKVLDNDGKFYFLICDECVILKADKIVQRTMSQPAPVFCGAQSLADYRKEVEGRTTAPQIPILDGLDSHLNRNHPNPNLRRP